MMTGYLCRYLRAVKLLPARLEMMGKDEFTMSSFLHPREDLHLMEITLNNDGVYLMFPDNPNNLIHRLLCFPRQAVNEIEAIIGALKIYLISSYRLNPIALSQFPAVTMVVCSVPPRSQTGLIRV